nr:RDD family protein [Desulfobulbaceae bacterium]
MTINNGENETALVPRTVIAGFRSRFMAFTIDCVLLFFLMALVSLATGLNVVALSSSGQSFLANVQLLGGWLVWLLMGVCLSSMCYFCLMHACCGQTIGKKIMGIRLESYSANGLGVGICFLRWVGYIASALPFFFGFLWALLDIEGRTWHDRLAGTRVVYG